MTLQKKVDSISRKIELLKSQQLSVIPFVDLTRCEIIIKLSKSKNLVGYGSMRFSKLIERIRSLASQFSHFFWLLFLIFILAYAVNSQKESINNSQADATQTQSIINNDLAD